MKDIKVGKYYYVISYGKDNKWDIFSKKIEQVQKINSTCNFCYYKNGGSTEDYVFEKLSDAIAKKNRANLLLDKGKRGAFYNGRIIWINTKNFGITKSIITEIDYRQIEPTFKIRPWPKTLLYKSNKDLFFESSTSDINVTYNLYPYGAEKLKEIC